MDFCAEVFATQLTKSQPENDDSSKWEEWDGHPIPNLQ